jgi:transposase
MPNDESGIATLLARVQVVHPTLIVLEATGGLEMPVTAALAAAGLPVVVGKPRQARDFVSATGRLAKTDALDAQELAHFAEAVRPAPKPLPDAQSQALSALLARRRQLLDMLTAEHSRLGSGAAADPGDIQAHVTWLERRVTDLDRDIGAAIRASPVWREHDALLQREHSLFFSGYLPRLVSDLLSVARKNPVEGAIVFGAAQGQHLVGVGHSPTRPLNV